MPPFIDFTTVGDYYMIVADRTWAMLLVLAYTALFAVAVPCLANLRQPEPHAGHWEWISSRRHWKKTVH